MKTFALTTLLALATAAVSMPSGDDVLSTRGDRDNCYKISDKDARGIIDSYSKLVRGEKYANDNVLADKHKYYSHSSQSAHGGRSTHNGLVSSSKKEFLKRVKNSERVGRVKTLDYVVKCNDIWVYSYVDGYGDSRDDIYGFDIHTVEQKRKDRGFQIARTRGEFDSVALSRGFDGGDHDGNGGDRDDDRDNDKDKNGNKKDEDDKEDKD